MTVILRMMLQSLKITVSGPFQHQAALKSSRMGPWYTHKKHPSFRDMIAAVRRLIIAAREYSYEVDDDDFPQVFQTLAHAAGHLPVTLAITVEAA